MFTSSVKDASTTLSTGGVIAYPTETVYGLGCLPGFPKSIQLLLDIKQRAASKGLILLGAHRAHLEPFIAPLSEAQWQKIETPRQRATTWIVPASPTISPLISGQRDTVAIRLTTHRLAATLCENCNSALISTSANMSGQTEIRTADALPAELTQHIALTLSGQCGPDLQPSQILDIFTGKVTRS